MRNSQSYFAALLSLLAVFLNVPMMLPANAQADVTVNLTNKRNAATATVTLKTVNDAFSATCIDARNAATAVAQLTDAQVLAANAQGLRAAVPAGLATRPFR